MKYEYLREWLKDWTIITSAKRLRGCLLHCAREMKRHGHHDMAGQWEGRIKKIPAKLDKESINYVLFGACIEVGLID